jgi:Prophage CP4-57 regulatory protein (AlpA)
MSLEDHPQTPNAPALTTAEIELWDRAFVQTYFGGSKPLHISTLYRGMADGIYPKPIRASVNSVRWLADECRAALRRMIAERDQPPKRPEYRGRPRRQIATDTGKPGAPGGDDAKPDQAAATTTPSARRKRPRRASCILDVKHGER